MVGDVGIFHRFRRAGAPAVKLETFIRQNARVNDSTVLRYAAVARSFQGWVSSRPLNPETVQDGERWLRERYKPNSLSNVVTAVNLWLRWKNHPELRMRRPPKEFNPRPRTIDDKEYRQLVARITDPMERLAVRLSHDTGWSPNDIAAIQRTDVDLSGPAAIVRKVRQKTRVVAEAGLLKETADELRAYLAANPDKAYLFPGDRRQGKPHRNRTWVNAVLKRHGASFSPRAFRSNLATIWPGDDIKGLMVQGGWSDSKTIFAHYRGNIRERQIASLEAAMGRPAKEPERDAELPGYG
jgi:integrase